MARLFVDSGVLIAAARGAPVIREAALALLTNPQNNFLTSPFVYLETVPKARYGRRDLELAMYRLYFDHAHSYGDVHKLLQSAIGIAEHDGVGPMDALHVAAAVLCEADALVTLENLGRSIYRATAIPVRHLLRT
jgi:predicted nucleic acid-binding protein